MKVLVGFPMGVLDILPDTIVVIVILDIMVQVTIIVVVSQLLAYFLV